MSRAGCPDDNAMAVSFMKTIKGEEVNASEYEGLAHAGPQLICLTQAGQSSRIRSAQARYHGDFTLIASKLTMVYPSSRADRNGAGCRLIRRGGSWC